MMNPELIQFFHKLDRSYFMETLKASAGIDSALPIGYGQTISQPSLVCYMTELLALSTTTRVLEIGTGSGYQTAFLAEFGREVFTMECIAPLLEKAKTRLDALGYANITYFLGDGSVGLPEFAPYDRIIVTAAASKIPDELLEQLSPNGILVIPVGDDSCQELLVVTKDPDKNITIKAIEAVRFVPLIGKYSI